VPAAPPAGPRGVLLLRLRTGRHDRALGLAHLADDLAHHVAIELGVVGVFDVGVVERRVGCRCGRVGGSTCLGDGSGRVGGDAVDA